MSTLTQRVLAASDGRDRVLDAVKATALLVVIVGHSLAWHIRPDGSAVNVLEDVPWLIALTWIFQVLPLFFAAGAVSNAASLARHGRNDYLRTRGVRLIAPVIVYATFWTALTLPFHSSETVVGAGKFLSQLLWFAGIYLLVAAAAVFTVRWVKHPVASLGVWLALILAVDALRYTDASALSWLNMLLVWGWLHQVGYYLPNLRGRTELLPAGIALIGLAVLLAFIGPFSRSLVSVAGVPGWSNLAPPSVILAIFGAGQILLVAALWPALQRGLSHNRIWVPVALVGARGMGMYLWHIPLVGAAAATAMAVGWTVPPLSAGWWLVHLAVAVVVLPTAWLIAGAAARPERRLSRLPGLGLAGAGCVLGGAVILNISVTGFATWRGSGVLGLPSSAALNIALIWAALGLTARRARQQPAGNLPP